MKPLPDVNAIDYTSFTSVDGRDCCIICGVYLEDDECTDRDIDNFFDDLMVKDGIIALPKSKDEKKTKKKEKTPGVPTPSKKKRRRK